ncbi:Uncharacterized protein FKW44_025197, partial [Caligus rogercresseyi]
MSQLYTTDNNTEVDVLKTISAITIHENEALKLSAVRQTTDRSGNKRVAGEEWLVLQEVVKAHIPLPEVAILVRSNANFKDKFEIERKNGDQYLITCEETSAFIPDVQERILGTVEATTLDNRHYCTIVNPIGEDGKPMLGHRKIIKGEISFFLKPGEELEDGVKEVFIIGEDEGIVLKAIAAFLDESVSPSINRKPGDRWMIKGPMEYTPSIEVEIMDVRKAIPLHANEGIYVRNIQTGSIRSVIGKTYMLKEDEELWEKNLPSMIQTLLNKDRDVTADRGEWINPGKEKRAAKEASNADVGLIDTTRVVTFKVPHNAAVQIYDYKSRLSPKRGIYSIISAEENPRRLIDSCLGFTSWPRLLLELQLSYNWHFAGEKNQENGAKLFTVPDFIGDMCNSIASRVRGTVSSHSAKIIRSAVLGTSKKISLSSSKQSHSLQKSVTLAIEITTQSQEAAAKREAERIDQEANGRLERQRITDEAEAERSRKRLLELQAESAIIEAIGSS